MAQPKTRSVFQWSSLFRTTLVGGTIRIGLVSAALIAVPAFFITVRLRCCFARVSLVAFAPPPTLAASPQRFDEDIKNSVILRATRLVRDLNPSHQQVCRRLLSCASTRLFSLTDCSLARLRSGLSPTRSTPHSPSRSSTK